MSWDWTKRAIPKSIAHMVLGRVKDGTILVFHDSDSTPGAAKGSPAQVVAALPLILEGLKQKGLQVVPLEEIIAHSRRTRLKNCVRVLWSLFERLIRRLAGIEDIGSGKTSIWRIALRRYRGKDWHMPDGSVLHPGDYYLELHINNERLLSLINENTTIERMAITAMREVQRGIPELVQLLNNDERFKNVNVLLGITLLHRGTGRFGFTAYDMKPGLFFKITCWYEKWLLALFHPGGFKSLKTYRETLSPKYVVLTRQELMNRYSPAGENGFEKAKKKKNEN